MIPVEKIDPTVNYVYAIRNDPSEVEKLSNLSECYAEMPQRFIFGSIRGSLVQTMKTIVNQVFVDAIEFQFQEPNITEENLFKVNKSDDPAQDEEITSSSEYSTSKLIDLSRPSDCRLNAVSSKLSGFNANGDDSHLLPTRTKSKITSIEKKTESQLNEKGPFPIKDGIKENVHKLINSIDWTISHLVDSVNIPAIYTASDQEHIGDDRKIKVTIDSNKLNPEELEVEQLKEIVDGWLKYISKQLINIKEREPEEFTPLAEHQYWLACESELNGIVEQMKNEIVIKTLDKVDKSMRKKFDKIIMEVRNAHGWAKENSNYLSTLKDYLIVSKQNKLFK